MTTYDPFKPVKFDRSPRENAEFLLFCILVPGKHAEKTKDKLDKILADLDPQHDAIDTLDAMTDDALLAFLQKHRTGQYRRIMKSIRSLGCIEWQAKPDRSSLEKAIGLKSATLFLLYSHNARVAVLDVHVLRFIRERLGVHAPPTTPSSKSTYDKLETIFLEFADDVGLSPLDADFAVWAMGKDPEVVRQRIPADRLAKIQGDFARIERAYPKLPC